MLETVKDTQKISITSEAVEFLSRSGKRMLGFIDVASDCPRDGHWVVMAPKYGQSKKNNLQLAYYFARNGMRVLRFDQTNHIGESEGDIVDYTLPGSVDDLLAAVDFLELQEDSPNLILLANSMSARSAIRAASIDSRIERLVCLVGVVNFQSTITTICQKDIVCAYLDGAIQGIGDILGHDVNIDQFLKACVDTDMHDLGGTLKDVKNTKCDIFMFSAEKDAWVEPADLEKLEHASDRINFKLVPGAMHELMENPKVAMDTILQAVFVSKYGRFPENNELNDLAIPDKKEIFRQNKVERDRLRAVAPLRESEGDFWQKYLDKYKMLESVGAYREYLELIGGCLGSPKEGMVYFDCGCGNGMFGAWCLRDLALSQNLEFKQPSIYFGLDLTGKGLSEAARRHSTISAESEFREVAKLFDMMYYRFDLDEIDPVGGQGLRLPFEADTVDRVCCSLLISYLKNPVSLLRELHRILKPGGRMIVSSMKPYCDLSVIYKGFVTEAESEDAIESARNLLSAAGAIQLKEEEGHYIFYSEDELAEVVRQAGFEKTQCFRSFGDQANLVTVAK